jgi:xylulokinase
MLKATHMRRDQMPELFEGTDATGRITDKLAKDWGMPLKPVVAGGGGDNASSAVGLGAVNDGDAILSLGTSGVMFVSNAKFSPNTARAIHAFCHAVPNTWHQMGVFLSATDSIEWLSRLLKRPVPKLTAALGKKLTGPSPVLLMPYFSGERTPVADAQIRAAFIGMDAETGAKEMTHAVLDGVAFAFRDSLEALRQGGATVNRLTAVGGGTKSEIWLKIIATALGIPIDVPVAGEVGGAFGGARMGLMAATGAPFGKICTKPKIARTIMPEKSAQAAYEAAYRRYSKIYSAVKDIK